MKPPPTIETDRLILRLPEPSEASAVLNFFERNRDHLEPWGPLPAENFYTVEFWESALWDNVNAHANDQSLRTFVFKRDAPSRVVGNCNLSNIVRGAFQAAYLGYNLDKDEQGQGIMTEAVKGIVECAFGELNLHRVMANYIPTNHASARVLEKAGFEKEGFAPQYLRIDGTWQDHVLTAITSDRWRP